MTEATNIRLAPMSAAAFDAWIDRQNAGYAADKVKAGNWPIGGARERAQTETRALLPAGVATPGHHFFEIVSDRAAEAVGTLWVKTDIPLQGGGAFIYSIEVDERHRGHGVGSAALEALASWLAARGAVRLSLHVFGFNEDAQRLYRRLGFEVTNVNMTRRLA